MDNAKTDEQIREMNAEFAARAGFTAEEEFDEREAAYDASRENAGNKDAQDEQIREMNAEFAARAGFTAEEEFDGKEAERDA